MKLSLAIAGAVLVSALACSVAQDDGGGARFAVTPLTFPAGENAVHLADFDGDGALDLLSVSEADAELSIRLGDGTGGFAAAVRHSVGEWPAWIDSADLNQDGRLDLAIAHHEQSFFSVVLGDGAGGVAGIERIALPAEIAPHTHMVRAADLDGDGAADLVFDSRDRFGLFVLTNEPGAALRFRAAPVDVRGAPYLGFAVGDVNADSLADLATPNGNDVSLLLNGRGGAARLGVAQQLPVPRPFSVALADLDGKAGAELIAASEDEAQGITVFARRDAASFATEAAARYEMAAGPKSLAAGDLDGDGCADVIAAAWARDLAVVLGCAAGARLVRPPLERLTAPWSIAVGDVNGDGRDEFVVVDGESGRANLYSLQSR